MEGQNIDYNQPSELAINDIIYLLFKGKWLILAFLILFVFGVHLYSVVNDTPMYQATASMVVNAKQTIEIEENGKITQSAGDIYLAQKLVSTYSIVLKSDRVMEYVINDLGLDIQPEVIRSWVTLSPQKDTQVLFLKVTCPQPQLAVDIANSMMKVAPRAMMETVEIGNVNVLDKARALTNVSSVNTSRNMAIAGALGLLLGGGFSIFYGVLFPKIKNSDEIKNELLLPTLGEIPHMKLKNKNNNDLFYMSRKVKDYYINAISMLGSVLQYIMASQNIKTVVITSALGEEGKTTISTDVAFSLAQSGKSVLLIDGDLRKPSIHSRLGLDNSSKNIVNVFRGEISQDDCVVKINDNLSVISGNRLEPREAVSLFSSFNAKTTMAHYRENYDFVLVDTSPVCGVADVTSLMSYVDGVIMVIKQDYATRSVILGSLNDLRMAGGNILGCILNNIRRDNVGGYYKKYYYTKKYSNKDKADSSI